MANKHVDLFKVMMPAVDANNKSLWDKTTEEGRKEIKSDLWNLNRYISSIKTRDADLAGLQILKVNEYYNKNWAVLSKHDSKLLWQLLCVAGDVGKTYFHPWIKLEKKKSTDNKAINFLLKIYPNIKYDEAELLARISTKSELKKLAESHGYEKIDL